MDQELELIVAKRQGFGYELEAARRIQRQLGVKPAADYMARRGWSIESTLRWLLGREAR
jgi:hypothetical protein